MAKKASSVSKKELIVDLLDQLDRNSMTGKYYIDLVNDYAEMYDTKKKLIDDIKTRGVSVYYNNGGGQSGYKKNESVDQWVKVNGQMLKILDALGIKPSQGGGADDDMEM